MPLSWPATALMVVVVLTTGYLVQHDVLTPHAFTLMLGLVIGHLLPHRERIVLKRGPGQPAERFTQNEVPTKPEHKRPPLE